jgi:hypothetical protein
VRFDDFESTAWQHWLNVPAEYREGVAGLMIERDARVHPAQPDVYTLGECQTETFPSDHGGPETTRSTVVLYYGSFLRLAHDDPEFDWEHELWETLTHELQHHLETLATEDDLEDFDYAVEQNYRRLNGEAFDPLFFRAGLRLSRACYQVEHDVFIEQVSRAVPAQPITLDFEWAGTVYRVPRPLPSDDVRYVRVNGGPQIDGGNLWLVFVPRHGILRQLREAVQRRPLTVSEDEVFAEPVN